MAKSFKIYGDWQQHDGKIVLLNGIQHRLSCRVFTQRYPYEERMIDVSATPVNKGTKFYRETRCELGDDWSTDVLGSDIEVACEILRQLETVS